MITRLSDLMMSWLSMIRQRFNCMVFWVTRYLVVIAVEVVTLFPTESNEHHTWVQRHNIFQLIDSVYSVGGQQRSRMLILLTTTRVAVIDPPPVQRTGLMNPWNPRSDRPAQVHGPTGGPHLQNGAAGRSRGLLASTAPTDCRTHPMVIAGRLTQQITQMKAWNLASWMNFFLGLEPSWTCSVQAPYWISKSGILEMT